MRMAQLLLALTLALAAAPAAGDELARATADLQAGRVAEAEARLARLVQQRSGDAEVHVQLALARLRLQRFRPARDSFLEAVRLAPGDARAWKGLGVTFAAEEDYARAEEPFRRACELNPREEHACYYLGRTYYFTNRYERAVTAFEAALRDDPRPGRVRGGMGLALEALGRHDEAERRYREAARQYREGGDPDDHPLVHLGALLFKTSRLPEARRELERAVRAVPDSPRARFELARLLVAEQQLEPAARHLREALVQHDGYAAAHLLLGKVYYRLGRLDEAERHARLGEELEQRAGAR
jgi:tetratricopeptide (TPR) repeat protein